MSSGTCARANLAEFGQGVLQFNACIRNPPFVLATLEDPRDRRNLRLGRGQGIPLFGPYKPSYDPGRPLSVVHEHSPCSWDSLPAGPRRRGRLGQETGWCPLTEPRRRGALDRPQWVWGGSYERLRAAFVDRVDGEGLACLPMRRLFVALAVLVAAPGAGFAVLASISASQDDSGVSSLVPGVSAVPDLGS
jgi:hypothetical protein